VRERVLGPRRGLPTNRAVVGGLLVAVALIATWWAASGAGHGPTTRYVVAARTLGPGQRLRAEDLRLEAVDLPAGLRSHALTETTGLDDVVVTGPVEAGELLQSSLLARTAGGRSSRELSLVVDADWAVGGTLRAGDRIDVLVTYGDGTASQTDVVLGATTVRRVTTAEDGGLGGTRSQTITIAVDDPEAVKAVTNAARAGSITITRATGTTSGRAGTTPYRPAAGSGPGAERADPAEADPADGAGTTTTTTRRRKATTTTTRAQSKTPTTSRRAGGGG